MSETPSTQQPNPNDVLILDPGAVIVPPTDVAPGEDPVLAALVAEREGAAQTAAAETTLVAELRAIYERAKADQQVLRQACGAMDDGQRWTAQQAIGNAHDLELNTLTLLQQLGVSV